MEHEEQLTLSLGHLVASSGKRREFRARFCKAGRIRAAGNRKSKILIEPGALTSALARGLFEGKAVFVDHAGWFDYPSLKNLAGHTKSAMWNELEQSVEGTIVFYAKADEYVKFLDELLAE